MVVLTVTLTCSYCHYASQAFHSSVAHMQCIMTLWAELPLEIHGHSWSETMGPLFQMKVDRSRLFISSCHPSILPADMTTVAGRIYQL